MIKICSWHHSRLKSSSREQIPFFDHFANLSSSKNLRYHRRHINLIADSDHLTFICFDCLNPRVTGPDFFKMSPGGRSCCCRYSFCISWRLVSHGATLLAPLIDVHFLHQRFGIIHRSPQRIAECPFFANLPSFWIKVVLALNHYSTVEFIYGRMSPYSCSRFVYQQQLWLIFIVNL